MDTLSTLPENLQESFKEAVEKPLILSSRSYSEEGWLLTCNTETGEPEALFVLPESVKEYAEEEGQVLLERDGLLVFFDGETSRLPLPATCETVKEVAQEYDRPFYILTASEPPDDLKEEGTVDGGSSAMPGKPGG